ncbi:M56 family metallopeptidase [Flavonifractor sp. An306]|uniref:M56 family metallopeptidase n=1 Tax=Flavonifractor sp. An306 TaxID=1965629 RepID=UPI00174B8534|nr:M56 family metallopeptidase [Flavonifractor sp. An306]
MKALVLTLLSLSLSGSLLCLLLLAVRPLLRRVGGTTAAYYLWLLVLLRLVVPVGVGVTVSLPERGMEQAASSLPAVQQEQMGTPAGTPAAGNTAVTAEPGEPDGAPELNPAAPRTSAPALELWDVLGGVWLAGAAGYLGWHMAAGAVFTRRVRRSLLPPEPREQAMLDALDNLPAVLRHELTHYRRRDLWYKALLALVTGIHWFNPLVHSMGRAVSLDCERSCDRAVVKGLDAGERRAYGNMLLALAARRRLPPGVTATTLWEGKRQLKARLLEIRDCKRVTGAGVCLMAAAVLLLGCCACGLPDWREAEPTPVSSVTPESREDPYAGLLARYERAIHTQQLDEGQPALVAAVVNPDWIWGKLAGLRCGIGCARMDLNGDGVEELVLGWLDAELWNMDEGYVFAIYTLVDGQPVLAVEGWERNRYVVGEDGYLYNAGSSGADQHQGNKYRFDPSRADFLELAEQTHGVETEDRWMASGTAIAATPFWEESLPAGYEGVLLGEEPIIYYADGAESRPVYLGEVPALFSPDSPYAAVGGWAAVDLDGDGTAETVLQIIDVGNDMGGYLILRRQGDRVYGYPSGWRTFWSLKTDGPFLCSEWAGTKESVVSLRFTDGGYEQVEHLTAEGEQFIFTSFTVEGRQVTEEEWQAAWDAQEQKPDAWWYALPEKTE